jgi:DNA-binding response OmpR family regulator
MDRTGELVRYLASLGPARNNRSDLSWDRDPAQVAVELSQALRVLPMPRTVLVVDDERDTNDILASLMQARGFEPIQVFSGAQALLAVSEQKPDLILLDLMLPDTDGFDLCDQLKRDRETNLIPIVMVTALQDAHHRAAGVRVGANGYLIKPFTPAQLYDMVDTALAWHEEHQQRGTTGEINFDVRSELTYLSEASDMLADLFAHTPLTDRHIRDLKQAVMEMGGNAIEWGHKKNADLVLRLTYRIDPSSVTLIIQDQGPGFNPRNLPHAASDEDPIGHIEIRNELGLREGGFGIMLARGLVDEFRYNQRGNEVTLVKYFQPKPKTKDGAEPGVRGSSVESREDAYERRDG